VFGGHVGRVLLDELVGGEVEELGDAEDAQRVQLLGVLHLAQVLEEDFVALVGLILGRVGATEIFEELRPLIFGVGS